jgi:hypothetical protein
MKILYLMGAGHVGSTVIDVVIGAHPRIESLGEAWKLPSAWAEPASERVCACGAAIHACAFWQEARRLWAERVGDDDVARYVALISLPALAYSPQRPRYPPPLGAPRCQLAALAALARTRLREDRLRPASRPVAARADRAPAVFVHRTVSGTGGAGRSVARRALPVQSASAGSSSCS